MKLAWISLLIAACDVVEPSVEVTPTPPCEKCDTPMPLPSGCSVVRTEEGPTDHLVDYAVSPQAQWLLTYDERDFAALWRREADVWEEVGLDRPCRYGVLALDRDQEPALACAVRSAVFAKDSDVEIYRPSNATWQRAYAAASAGGWSDSTGGEPLSLVFDAQNRAHVAVAHTANGRRDGYDLASQRGAWVSGTLYPAGAPAYASNFRLATRGADVYFAFKRGTGGIEVNRVTPGGRYEPVASVWAGDQRAGSFGADFELLADPDDSSAWHVVMNDLSTIYDDLGGVGYVAYDKIVDGDVRPRSYIDGPVPIHDQSAGLEGVSAAVHPDGTLLVSYDAYNREALRVAYKDGNAWVRTDLWFDGVVGNNVMRFDDAGHMHIAVQNLSTGMIELREERCAP